MPSVMCSAAWASSPSLERRVTAPGGGGGSCCTFWVRQLHFDVVSARCVWNNACQFGLTLEWLLDLGKLVGKLASFPFLSCWSVKAMLWVRILKTLSVAGSSPVLGRSWFRWEMSDVEWLSEKLLLMYPGMAEGRVLLGSSWLSKVVKAGFFTGVSQ